MRGVSKEGLKAGFWILGIAIVLTTIVCINEYYLISLCILVPLFFAIKSLYKIIDSCFKLIFLKYTKCYEGKIIGYKDQSGRKGHDFYFPIVEYTKDGKKCTHESNHNEKPNQLNKDRKLYRVAFEKPFLKNELPERIAIHIFFFITYISIASLFLFLFNFEDLANAQLPGFIVSIMEILFTAKDAVVSFLSNITISDEMIVKIGLIFIRLFFALIIARISLLVFKSSQEKKIKENGIIKEAKRIHTVHYHNTHINMSTYEFEHDGTTKQYQGKDWTSKDKIQLYYDEKRDIAVSDYDSAKSDGYETSWIIILICIILLALFTEITLSI